MIRKVQTPIVGDPLEASKAAAAAKDNPQPQAAKPASPPPPVGPPPVQPPRLAVLADRQVSINGIITHFRKGQIVSADGWSFEGIERLRQAGLILVSEESFKKRMEMLAAAGIVD